MTEDSQPISSDRPTIEIVRDSTFTRFVADEGLICDLGRDLEVGFIQYGDMFVSQTDHDDHEATHCVGVLTEVARMRISYPAMVRLVMAFIRKGIEEERLKGEGILKSLEKWVEESKAREHSDHMESE